MSVRIIYHNSDLSLQQAPRSSNSTLLYYQRSQEQVKGLEMIPDLMAQLPFHKNELLFGHDSTPSLIACEIEGLDRVRIFRRQGDLTLSESAPFQPFLLLEDDGWLKEWKGHADLKPLAGSGAFRHLAPFPDLNQLE